MLTMRGILGGLWCNNALPIFFLVLTIVLSFQPVNVIGRHRYESGVKIKRHEENPNVATVTELVSGQKTPRVVKRSTGHQVSPTNYDIRTNDKDGPHVVYKVIGTININGTLEAETATVFGVRVEKSPKEVEYEDNGVVSVLANAVARLRLFGERFSQTTIIRFVTTKASKGSNCNDLPSTKSFAVFDVDMTQRTALSEITLPPLDVGESIYYLCVRDSQLDMPWVHMGEENWILFKSYTKLLPLWVQIVFIVLLLVCSGLFSGLNLGLMSIDRTELKIIANTGSDREKRYAKQIQPVRASGNYLLCSLLLGNVLVNSVLTILMDDLTSGVIAIISSTLGIVIFGEIIPQAICSRYGLAVGARTLIFTKVLMVITFPLSYPISLILDRVLGEEIGHVYNRERLKELIKVTDGYNDLEKDEVQIIAGALELKQKTVSDVMTKIEEVYMLPADAVLDFNTVSEIMNEGFTRIPVYENEKKNVVALLHIKDLAFVDPDDKMPLKTICEFYSNPCNFVTDDLTLDVVFRDFKEGNKGHMSIVKKYHSSDYGDPYYEVVGIVTLEDVIEALIQSDIKDENDVLVGGKRNKRRSRVPTNTVMSSYPSLIKPDELSISPQLKLAAFQYLSTSVEQFHSKHISKTILERLLNQHLFNEIKIKKREKGKHDPETVLYEQGKPADYFILILDGRVQAEMGKEHLVFESGPFTFFGTQSLNQNVGFADSPSTPASLRRGFQRSSSASLENLLFSTFVPDYTVKAVTDVTYLKISRSIYLAAKQATLLERTLNANSSEDSVEKDKMNYDFERKIDMMVREKDENGSTSTKVASDDECNDSNYGNTRASNDLSIMPKKGVYSGVILSPKFLYNDDSKMGSIRSLKMPSLNGDLQSRQRTNSVGSKTSNKKKEENNNLSKLADLPPSGYLAKRRHSHMPTSGFDKYDL